MKTLTVHSIETAPEGSKASLEQSVKAFGMLPNLHGVLAGAPKVLEAYKILHDLFSNTSFNAEELTVVWQSINVEHGCHYCVPAHTGIAHMMEVDADLTEALRSGKAMPNEKLQTLKDTTLSIVRNRGRITDSEIERFYAVGYGEQQILEIILGLAQKTISNYSNHIADTPVDEAFQNFAWKPQEA